MAECLVNQNSNNAHVDNMEEEEIDADDDVSDSFGDEDDEISFLVIFCLMLYYIIFLLSRTFLVIT